LSDTQLFELRLQGVSLKKGTLKKRLSAQGFNNAVLEEAKMR